MDEVEESEAIKVAKSVKVEESERRRREKRKKKLLKEAEKANNKGVCYLSRIPPKMDPLKLRQILSSYGEILRIYLAPEDPTSQMRRKKSGGFRGQEFSEGWVEFVDKRIAKRVAKMLNGEQIDDEGRKRVGLGKREAFPPIGSFRKERYTVWINFSLNFTYSLGETAMPGGKKRSQFYYDIWNIKYLSKFKWDDLTEEIAYRNAIREQKLQMELSAAKREKDFYLSKVERSRALSEIEERLRKKRKVQNKLEADPEDHVEHQNARVIRQFPQKQPLVENVEKSKPKLSKDVLAEVFNISNEIA